MLVTDTFNHLIIEIFNCIFMAPVYSLIAKVEISLSQKMSDSFEINESIYFDYRPCQLFIHRHIGTATEDNCHEINKL